jgi:hypothetical protein
MAARSPLPPLRVKRSCRSRRLPPTWSHRRVARPPLRHGRRHRLPHRHAPALPRHRRHALWQPHRPDPPLQPPHRFPPVRSRLPPARQPPSRYPHVRQPLHPGLTPPLRPHRPGRRPPRRSAQPPPRHPALPDRWRRLPPPQGPPRPAVRPQGLPPPALPSSLAVRVPPCGREQAAPRADPALPCVRRPDAPSWWAVPSPGKPLVGPQGLRPLPPLPGRSVRALRPPCGPRAAVAHLALAAVPPAVARERPPSNWWASRSDATAAAPRVPALVPVPLGQERRPAPEACPRACASRWRPAS